jgi:hypothetical protein
MANLIKEIQEKMQPAQGAETQEETPAKVECEEE